MDTQIRSTWTGTSSPEPIQAWTASTRTLTSPASSSKSIRFVVMIVSSITAGGQSDQRIILEFLALAAIPIMRVSDALDKDSDRTEADAGIHGVRRISDTTGMRYPLRPCQAATKFGLRRRFFWILPAAVSRNDRIGFGRPPRVGFVFVNRCRRALDGIDDTPRFFDAVLAGK